MKGLCPHCEALVTITETGVPIGAPGKQGTATYKQITQHPDERTASQGVFVIVEVCKGSGRRV